jgi:hypothetical protein
MKGLIIDRPWIDYILDGNKTWEMRSGDTRTRGLIALIAKGTGRIVGLADLVDSIGPIDEITWRAHADRHRIPLNQYESTKRWDHAWVLDRVRPLSMPVAYEHPSGAVIWVSLDPALETECLASIAPANSASPLPPADPSRKTLPTSNRQSGSGPSAGFLPQIAGDEMVPVAADGTWFSPRLARNGVYTIGAKDEERRVTSYTQALDDLKRMRTPHWRRPNPAGNWGIVAGVTWQSARTLRPFPSN